MQYQKEEFDRLMAKAVMLHVSNPPESGGERVLAIYLQDQIEASGLPERPLDDILPVAKLFTGYEKNSLYICFSDAEDAKKAATLYNALYAQPALEKAKGHFKKKGYEFKTQPDGTFTLSVPNIVHFPGRASAFCSEIHRMIPIEHLEDDLTGKQRRRVGRPNQQASLEPYIRVSNHIADPTAADALFGEYVGKTKAAFKSKESKISWDDIGLQIMQALKSRGNTPIGPG